MAVPTITTGTHRDYVQGNVRVVQETATGSTLSNGAIWTPGLRIIESVDLMLTSDTNITWGVTITNGTGGGGGQGVQTQPTGATATFNLSGTPSGASVMVAYGY